MQLTNNNPYILQALKDQELAGIQAQMQNTGIQQTNQNQAMAEAMALTKQAGQQQSSGINPLAMASALRKDKKKPTDALKKDVEALGSNTWNPLSDYNTGANGWGNFGE